MDIILGRRDPLLRRRYRLLTCKQKDGEIFSEWLVRLENAIFEAEVENGLTLDDLLQILLLVLTSNESLRSHFLRVKESEATVSEMKQTGIQWEAADNFERGLVRGAAANKVKISKYRKEKKQKSETAESKSKGQGEKQRV